jgi:hypothetical protein
VAYEPGAGARDAKEQQQQRGGGGVPDGLLVGGVALLASLATLTWTASGLGGVVAHGSWPENVSFVRTGTALRSFLTAPNDVPAAWPDSPQEQLPSATVLWLVFLTQIVVLFSTVMLVAIQVARWRVKRQARRGKRDQPGGLRPPGPPRDGRGTGGGGGSARVSLEPEVPTGPAEAPAAPGWDGGYETADPAQGPGGAGGSAPQAPVAYGRGPTHGGHGTDGPHAPSGAPGAAAAGSRGGTAGSAPGAPPAPGRSDGHGAAGAYAPDGGGWNEPQDAAAYGPGETPGAPPASSRGGTGGGTPSALAAGGPAGRQGRRTGASTAGAAGNVVAAVVGGPEGLVVLDPDGRVWSKTARQRGKLGPVHVYDPGHVTDAPVRLRWAPQRGCGDMAVARRRAAALLAPVRPTEPIFQLDAESAETLLRCYLHAAALAGDSIQHVLRWAHHGVSSNSPIKILRSNARAAPGASMELESTLTTHPGRRDAALELIGKALAGLEQLHIRQSCSPGRVDTLALDNIAGEGGTLYVVGDQKETAALRSALTDAVTADQPSLTVIN